MNINNTNILHTLKRINKIVKSMESASLKKATMGNAPPGQIDQHRVAIQSAKSLLEKAPVPGEPSVLGYTHLSELLSRFLSPTVNNTGIIGSDSPFFAAVRSEAPQILANNGILNGEPFAMNKKEISKRPRIFVAGPAASLDHGNAYYYMHTMLNRAMKLLGISHSQEPIFIFSQPHAAKSNYIYLRNIANGIHPSYERSDDMPTSMDASGLTRAFARTFGHDTFELPTTDVEPSSRSAFRQFMDTVGLHLATHAIILGQPDMQTRPMFDRRVHVRDRAIRMGLPVLTTSSAYETPLDAITSSRTSDIRQRIRMNEGQEIPDLTSMRMAFDLINNINVSANIGASPFKAFSCTIAAPRGWVPPEDQRLVPISSDGTSKSSQYSWSYNDGLNEEVSQQRKSSLGDDQHWIRLLSASPYRTMSGSFLLGDDGRTGDDQINGPLLGPRDFDPKGKMSTPASWLTLTPKSATEKDTPYLFRGPHLNLNGTTQMSVAKTNNPQNSIIQKTIADINNSLFGKSDIHRVPTISGTPLLIPAAIPAQFVDPRKSVLGQDYAVFSTHLKRTIGTRPVSELRPIHIPSAVQSALQDTDATVNPPSAEQTP